MAFDDTDTYAMWINPKKTRGIWVQVSGVLRVESSSPRVCGMFYKAAVQAVLLFGSERWIFLLLVMECLKGFHLKAACRMTGMVPKRGDNGTWVYPLSADVL